MNDARRERVIILPRMRSATEGLSRARTNLAAALALAACACATIGPDPAREEVANAERAFAADCVARGITASFVAHFAPDGLVFEPAPVRVRETWPARASGADAQLRLAWHPELVYVSRAADLAYSTGPFELTRLSGDRPPAHGLFFSVWQRQGDGQWKVWLDLGARTGAPVDRSAWAALPRARTGAQPEERATATTVSELDVGLTNLDAAAFARRLAVDARRNESGSQPLIGAAWVARLAADDARVEYVPSEARVSASGDFAASYGRVVRRAAGVTNAGHYVHVWLRDDGAWWLAVESLVYEND
ncbi:MAG TPA: nuclear transport factor 2 family protein [Casimicrobiaceae bacterium]|jgi:ketosteroid isomerase-like protein